MGYFHVLSHYLERIEEIQEPERLFGASARLKLGISELQARRNTEETDQNYEKLQSYLPSSEYEPQTQQM